jgi:hypothetical protein
VDRDSATTVQKQICKRLIMEYWWNDIDSGKPRVSEETWPSPTLSATTNPMRNILESNPGIRCERPVTNQPAESGHCLVDGIKVGLNRCGDLD